MPQSLGLGVSETVTPQTQHWTAFEKTVAEEAAGSHLLNVFVVFSSARPTSLILQAFPQCVFDHWQLLGGDATEEGSKSYDTVRATRKRKGLTEDLPPLDRYRDKL